MLFADRPSLVLAPMEGVTDAPMRALMGATGCFTHCVSEFVRVSDRVVPAKVFLRDVPELAEGARTPTGLPVQVQILGGDPERLAATALVAVECGALGVDLNFGCPAPTVNRHDGGATLLKHPTRIREIVRAVREAVPGGVPVSAKLRLGWDDIAAIDENAAMAVEGGADWLTVHARTRTQGYAPPVYWEPIGQLRRLGVPVVANGDIWTLDDFRRCQDVTGCRHFMIGRGALADPALPYRVARELGLREGPVPETDWPCLLTRFLAWTDRYFPPSPGFRLKRVKQWLCLAHRHGDFDRFDQVKRAGTVEEALFALGGDGGPAPVPL